MSWCIKAYKNKNGPEDGIAVSREWHAQYVADLQTVVQTAIGLGFTEFYILKRATDRKRDAK